MHWMATSSGRCRMSGGGCGDEVKVAGGGGLPEMAVVTVTEVVWSVIGVEVAQVPFT